MMTKTQCVMQRMEPSEQTLQDFTSFCSEDDDTHEMTREVVLHNDDVMDMGGPEFITVTIEPGDRMNDVEDAGRLDMETGHLKPNHYPLSGHH